MLQQAFCSVPPPMLYDGIYAVYVHIYMACYMIYIYICHEIVRLAISGRRRRRFEAGRRRFLLFAVPRRICRRQTRPEAFLLYIRESR